MAGRTIRQLKKDKRSKRKKQSDFLVAFETYAAVTRACKRSKVPRATVYTWLNDDDEFKKAYNASCKIAIAALEDEAIRRAHEGTVKAVYHQGVPVGKIREYSDTLLIFLLKGKAPEVYREKFAGTISNPDGSPLLSEIKVTITSGLVPIANKEEDVNVDRF